MTDAGGRSVSARSRGPQHPWAQLGQTLRGWLLRVGPASLVPTCPGPAAGRKKIKLSGLALDHKVTGDRFYTHVTIVGQRLSQKAPSLEEGADVFISSQDVRGASESRPESECLLKGLALGDREGGSSCSVSPHPKRSFSPPCVLSTPHGVGGACSPFTEWGESRAQRILQAQTQG